MKSLVNFTNEQLEIMAKEASPRGKNARYEIERRKSQHPLDKSSEQLDTVPENDVQQLDNGTETSTEAPKPSRKTTRKRKEV